MKVSVIVPVYNTGRYLEKCLDSLVNQTLKDIEIIVINDGSTEDISLIIKKYKNKIKYFENTNHGIGYTRNFGIKKAKGKYIGFVDSDDYVDKDMYLKYYDFAEKNNLDVVVANYKKHTNKDVIEMKINHFDIASIYENKRILVDIDYGPCNKIFRRELLIDNDIYFEEHLKYEDMPFVIKTLKYSKKIGHLDEAYYNYVVRGNSETTTVNERSFDIFKIFDIVNKIFEKDTELYDEIEYLNVFKLLDYNIHQRKQKDNKLRNKFIDKTFEYIITRFPKFRNNKYFKPFL